MTHATFLQHLADMDAICILAREATALGVSDEEITGVMAMAPVGDLHAAMADLVALARRGERPHCVQHLRTDIA